MHLYDVERGNLGANAVIGGGLPAVTGAGLAFKLRDEPRVAVAFFGDGATNIGTFHESLNLAQLWKTKTVFVCENNHWAESTPGWQHSPVWDDMSKRALAYDMRAIKVDGQDVEEVYDAAHEALEHARSGDGPVFLDVETYRMHGHYIGDPQVYRSKEDREDAADHDPITRLRERLGSRRRRVRGARRRGARDRRRGARVRAERHRPAARRRAQERLCLSSPTARRSATRSRRRCARTRTSSSWARTSPRWAARWASRRACSTSSAPERVRNTPISEMAIVGAGIGAAMAGHAPGRRDHVRGLPDALARADRQPGGEAPLHVGRAAQGAADDPHAGRRRLVAGRAARAAARGVARPRPGPQGRLPVDARGRARPALVVDLRRQPGRLLRAPAALPGQGRGAGGARADPARQGARRARGHRRDGDRDRPARAPLARRGRRRRRRRASRSRSSTRARCSRSTRTRSSRRSRRRTAPSSRTRP